jgi:hypothetical protein
MAREFGQHVSVLYYAVLEKHHPNRTEFEGPLLIAANSSMFQSVNASSVPLDDWRCPVAWASASTHSPGKGLPRDLAEAVTRRSHRSHWSLCLMAPCGKGSFK